jgi:phage shock protein C
MVYMVRTKKNENNDQPRYSANDSRKYAGTSPKRLYRSRKDIMVGGVCSGLAEYMVVDPTLIRLLWVVLTLITGFVPGLLAYLIAWIIIPIEPLK